MREYFFRFKEYQKEDVVDKELVEVNLGWDKQIYLYSVPVYKITDKTVMIGDENSGKYSGRLPIKEVGTISRFGRKVVPKEDVEEFIKFFQKSLTGIYQEEISNLEKDMTALNEAKIISRERN